MTKKLLSVYLLVGLVITSQILSFQARASEPDFRLNPGIESLMKFEQHYTTTVYDHDRMVPMNNTQAVEYTPQQAKIFELKTFWVKADSVDVFASLEEFQASGLHLVRTENGVREILFIVHPESESFFQDFVRGAKPGPVYEGTATASSRTLLAWPKDHPENLFFAKLSLNKELGKVIRTIPAGEVARGVGVTKILKESKNELPKGAYFMSEFFGVMPKGMSRGGMILRAIPPEFRQKSKRLIPLFALYSRSENSRVEFREKTVIQEMIERSGMSAESFVKERIIRPFVEQWLAFSRQGIFIEVHAQNVLLVVDTHGMPTGEFLYRDFGGFSVDLEYRRATGRPMPRELPVITTEQEDYHQELIREARFQSLYTYFEGGFLFGLGAEFERIGISEMSYEGLKSMLQAEIKAKLNINKEFSDPYNFHSYLMDELWRYRRLGIQLGGQCEFSFSRVN